MARNEPAQYLVCYDIADPRRLTRVHAILKTHALPVQYSVFLATLSPAGLDRLLEELRQVIDEGADDIRAYRVPRNPDYVLLGPSPLPAGVDLFQGQPAGGIIGLVAADPAEPVPGVAAYSRGPDPIC